MGEAITGALFLGAATSLPGIITSVVTAYQGAPNLALSNAIGGMAAQTVFLVVADLLYRHANLEHAAASVTNLLNAGLLVALLGIILMAVYSPNVTYFGIHPATPIIFASYIFGLRLSRQNQESPQWLPRQTVATIEDEAEESDDGSEEDRKKTSQLIYLFAITGIITAACGYVIAQGGLEIVKRFGLSESFVGVFMTAVGTSSPELVVTIAAVRRGALTLAVGNIIGGNSFDVLFAGAADVAYRDGSIYHKAQDSEIFLIGATITMTAVLILGLVSRERKGFGGIGFEGILVLLIYALLFFVIRL